MRLVLIAACATLPLAFSVAGLADIRPAASAQCTGKDCPPPDSGGHDCNHDKEQTTS